MMMKLLRVLWGWLISWFKPVTPLPLPVPVLAPVTPPPPVFPHRPGKFVKPKGETPEKQPAKPRQPRKPRVKLPDQIPMDDPEKWGQYYFRDAILDQLKFYFLYLHRMKKGDRDSYDLLHQVGIQLLPATAIEAFDAWRTEGQLTELSAWWKTTRPTFGAVAYGVDKKALLEDDTGVLDAPPEIWKDLKRRNPEDLSPNRLATLTGGPRTVEIFGRKEKVAIIWVPKFMYYSKATRVIWRKHKIEPVHNADIYLMTIYWDKIAVKGDDNWSKKHPGGVPQEYILAIDRDTNVVRLVRHEFVETVDIRTKKGKKGTVHIPNKYWTACPQSLFSWAYGRSDASPEQYLIRCFIEAALMHEASAMGSMIRVQVTKGNLVATFGVDIKRMSYFFKDRDIVLTDKGKRARIFHIVRPHMRKTKHGEKPIKLSFRGLRVFTWAGYRVKITVPGRDHLNINEFDVGFIEVDQGKPPSKGMQTMGELGKELTSWVDGGVGRWQPTKH